MKNYPYYNSTYYKTFAEYTAGLKQYGEKPALCSFDKNGNKTVRSYAKLCRDVNALKDYFYSKGYNGKRMAIAGENSYYWIVAFLAIASSGGVAICIDIDQTDDAIKDLVERADVEMAFVSSSILDTFEALLGADKLFLLDGADEKAQKYNDILSAIEDGAKITDVTYSEILPDDSCAIVFTSGTTSKPKAVSLTHKSMLTNLGDSVASTDIGNEVFSGLPLFHAYGLNCAALYSLQKGAMLTVCGKMRFIIRDTFLSEAHCVYCVPLIVEVIYQKGLENAEKAGLKEKAEKRIKQFANEDALTRRLRKHKTEELRRVCFGSLRRIVCGGAYVNPDIAMKMEALGVTIYQGYGITECSPLVAVNRNLKNDRDTVGMFLPSYEYKFKENGEICLRSPCVMKEYYKDPEATAAAIDEDGWFSTGDIGEMTSDGFLKITGRLKNIIVLNNGDKVSPEQLEQRLLKFPLIKEARVYGAPMGQGEDNVQPAVTIYPDPALTAGMMQYEISAALKEKIDEINAEVPVYQQIRMINIRETPFERTVTNKIKRSDN